MAELNQKFQEEKNKFFTHLFGAEGGASDDPLDPGGKTNYGISEAAHPSLKEDLGIGLDTLDMQKAREIYDVGYLSKDSEGKTIKRGGELTNAETNYGNNEFAFKMADIGINASPQIATQIMQKSLNKFGMNLEEDGKMGKGTRTAYNEIIDQGNNKELMDEIIRQQKLYYSGSEEFIKQIDDTQVEAYYIGKEGTIDDPKGGWHTRAEYRGGQVSAPMKWIDSEEDEIMNNWLNQDNLIKEDTYA